MDDRVLKLLFWAAWLSALPLVGISFAPPLDSLTSHATCWEQIVATYLFVLGPPGKAAVHFDALTQVLRDRPEFSCR